MPTPIKRTRLFITLTVSCFLIGSTILAIQFAKGYRPNFKQLSVSGTGLLSATSYPKSAQVYLADRLTTVTDNTLNLSPGEYQIKIIKTGFHVWTKSILIKPELVSTTEARLFPTIPSITPLTFYQISSPLLSPDGNKLVYVLTGSPFNEDNGVYVLSLANGLLPGNQITQIADLSTYDYHKAELVWSPDGSQILAVLYDNQKIIASHLLNPRGMNQVKNLTDITFKLTSLLTSWQEQLASVNKNNLARLPEFMIKVASESATNVYFSPDREKLLYTSTRNLEIPTNLATKPVISANPSPQDRRLLAGKTYVYDIKEDSNYLIKEANYDPKKSQPLIVDATTTATSQINLLRGSYAPHTTQNISWYPTSRHLIVTDMEGLSIVEYDDHNPTPIISTKVANSLAVPSPDGTNLIILSNLNQKPDIFNLISLNLK